MRDRLDLAVRPRVPRGLLPTFARMRATRSARSEGQRSEALRNLRFLLGDAAPQSDLEALLPEYLLHSKWRAESRWHFDLVVPQRIEGVDQARAAFDQGRGLLVNFMHHAYYDGIFATLATHGVPCAVVATPQMYEETMPLWMRQEKALVGMYTPPINAAEGKPAILAALKDGGVVAVATDVPGRTPMRFVGRDVQGSFGAALMAFDTGTRLALVTSHQEDPEHPEDLRRGPNAFLRVALLDPTDFTSPEELLAAMLAHHEAAITAWPQAYDQPLKRWTWNEAGD